MFSAGIEILIGCLIVIVAVVGLLFLASARWHKGRSHHRSVLTFKEGMDGITPEMKRYLDTKRSKRNPIKRRTTGRP